MKSRSRIPSFAIGLSLVGVLCACKLGKKDPAPGADAAPVATATTTDTAAAPASPTAAPTPTTTTATGAHVATPGPHASASSSAGSVTPTPTTSASAGTPTPATSGTATTGKLSPDCIKKCQSALQTCLTPKMLDGGAFKLPDPAECNKVLSGCQASCK